jgi:hypothetical protein
MPESTEMQTTEPEGEDVDTEAEFRSLWTDADDGRARFEALAKGADTAGQPESAKIYREIAGTVMTLMADLAAATGGAISHVEAEIDEMPMPGDAGHDGSGLLPEDADKYLQLFDQYIRLLDGLEQVVPSGTEGDAQREIFATLRRLTEGMSEFTRSITLDEPEEEEEEPENDPEETREA